MTSMPGYVSPSSAASSSNDDSDDESIPIVIEDGRRGKGTADDAISIIDSSDDDDGDDSSVEVLEVVPPDSARIGIRRGTRVGETICLLDASDDDEDASSDSEEDRKMPARRKPPPTTTDRADSRVDNDNDISNTESPPAKRKIPFEENEMVEYNASKGGYGLVEVVNRRQTTSGSFEYQVDWKGQSGGKGKDPRWWPERDFSTPSKKRARTRHVATNVSRERACAVSKQPSSSNDHVVALKKKTKEALLSLPCSFKHGVISDALESVGYPFGLETVLGRIMSASKGNVTASTFPDDEFKIGNKMKKAFDKRICPKTNRVVPCDPHLAEGEITSEGRNLANKKTYRVAYKDGDSEDLRPKQLRRPTQGKPRKFHFLELFSGKGVMSKTFEELGFSVQSVDVHNDKDAVSPPTLQKDIHDFDPATDLTALPDVVHVSIPCETYSNLSGDIHRVVNDSALKDSNLDISHEAREADFLLVKVIKILVYIKIHNPHVIITIENPKAKLRHMPLMKLLEACLDLHNTAVFYCAFGHPERKPTDIWTNVVDLSEKLNDYICVCEKKHECIRDGVGTHYSVIPKQLAAEIANTAKAHLYMENIHHTKAR